MKLEFGGFRIGDLNACGIAPKKTMIKNAAGMVQGWNETFTANFSFRADGQADCTAKMQAVIDALKYDKASGTAKDLIFYNDDGSQSANSVLAANTLGGIRCVSGPDWEASPGGQFATWRSGTCTFEWITKVSAISTFTPVLLKDWGETVVLGSQIRKFVVPEAINDVVSQPFPTVKFPKVMGSQSGFAVGINGYPTPAAPLFPPYPGPMIDEKVTRKDPERVGDEGYWNYRIEWNYQYLSAVPLIGLPTRWVG